ncbi:hypothetical protein ACQKKK_24820 [Peribacillus sp. NPDC006672]|uniref:hypothetical protein n=1 Tax=Peribacillus sp. NPDC006672 TaxID=3390606 RepID=UPI003D012324
MKFNDLLVSLTVLLVSFTHLLVNLTVLLVNWLSHGYFIYLVTLFYKTIFISIHLSGNPRIISVKNLLYL